MAYDKGLEHRITNIIETDGFAQKNMFGGVVWLLNENICFGIHKDLLVLRVGVGKADELMQKDHVHPMDITGRPMKGWVMVAPDGMQEEDELRRLTGYAISFVSSLPTQGNPI